MSIENQVKESRSAIYKAFSPQIRELQPLNLNDSINQSHGKKLRKSMADALNKILPYNSAPNVPISANAEPENFESHEVVTLREVHFFDVQIYLNKYHSFKNINDSYKFYTINKFIGRSSQSKTSAHWCIELSIG